MYRAISLRNFHVTGNLPQTSILKSFDANRVVFFMEEFFEGSWFSSSRMVKLFNFLMDKNLDLSKLTMIFEDYSCKDFFVDWLEKRKIKLDVKPTMKFIPTILLNTATMYRRHQTVYKILPKQKLNKKFICMMGRQNEGRESLYYFYKKEKMFESNHISYLGRGMSLEDSGEMKNIRVGNSTPSTDSITEFIDDSYFMVVPETECWFPSSNKHHSVFFTEKIAKALYYGHPFIVLAGCGFLKGLKDLGFETFPEFFDESYDDIYNHHIKTEKIKNEIRKLNNKKHKELSEMYNSVIDKLVHNQHRLLSLRMEI